MIIYIVLSKQSFKSVLNLNNRLIFAMTTFLTVLYTSNS